MTERIRHELIDILLFVSLFLMVIGIWGYWERVEEHRHFMQEHARENVCEQPSSSK